MSIRIRVACCEEKIKDPSSVGSMKVLYVSGYSNYGYVCLHLPIEWASKIHVGQSLEVDLRFGGIS
jgi:hypothetical protein